MRTLWAPARLCQAALRGSVATDRPISPYAERCPAAGAHICRKQRHDCAVSERCSASSRSVRPGNDDAARQTGSSEFSLGTTLCKTFFLAWTSIGIARRSCGRGPRERARLEKAYRGRQPEVTGGCEVCDATASRKPAFLAHVAGARYHDFWFFVWRDKADS